MLTLITKQKIYSVLRISAAMCFIGHGAFGIITKPVWCHYFAVFGIGNTLAYKMMPVVGVADILMGLMLLVYPVRIIVLWLVVWGFITAALRPLSGEAFPELIERAGNFGAPLVLLMLSDNSEKKFKALFKKIEPVKAIDRELLSNVNFVLRLIIFMLFLGHGWLNLAGKQGLLNQYASLGFSNPAHVAQLIGLFELIAAVSVLLRPASSVLIALLVWKIASELFYPHWEIFEWIERGGSYGCILTLLLTLHFSVSRLNSKAILYKV
jgi:uncharacterized membrane protein YphA (DoxX/SURF4 family)